MRVFWRGERICFRQSLAKDGAARSHVLHPLMKLDAFLINKQMIETKFSCGFQHAYMHISYSCSQLCYNALLVIRRYISEFELGTV